VWKYGIDIQSATAKNREEKKKKEERKKERKKERNHSCKI